MTPHYSNYDTYPPLKTTDLKPPTGIKMGRDKENSCVMVLYIIVFDWDYNKLICVWLHRLQVMGLGPNNIGNNTKINQYSSFSTTNQ